MHFTPDFYGLLVGTLIGVVEKTALGKTFLSRAEATLSTLLTLAVKLEGFENRLSAIEQSLSSAQHTLESIDSASKPLPHP